MENENKLFDNKRCRYMWVSDDFRTYIRQQQEESRKTGTEFGTAGATHRLLHDFIIPNNVRIQPPKFGGDFKSTKKRIC